MNAMENPVALSTNLIVETLSTNAEVRIAAVY
jgi:hypothetical protein